MLIMILLVPQMYDDIYIEPYMEWKDSVWAY